MASNEFIVIRHEKDHIQLAEDYFLPRSSLEGSLTFDPGLYKIESYDEASATLHLRINGKADSDLFSVSSAMHREWLHQHLPQNITIHHSFAKISALDSFHGRRTLRNEQPPKQHFTQLKEVEHKVQWEEKFPLLMAEFEDGFIRCTTYIKGTDTPIELTSKSLLINKSYDAIKDYFAKVLGKFLHLKITVTYRGKEFVSAFGTSETIDLINEDLLNKIDGLYAAAKRDSDDSPEIFPVTDLLPEGSVKKGKDTTSVIDTLFIPEKTKHYLHLRYLADRHAHQLYKLSTTKSPESYIFLVATGSSQYIVWETYKTEESTYCWRIDPTAEQYSSIEKIFELIIWLRKSNKLKYRKDTPPNCKIIDHDYRMPDFGFTNWRTEIEWFLK